MSSAERICSEVFLDQDPGHGKVGFAESAAAKLMTSILKVWLGSRQ